MRRVIIYTDEDGYWIAECPSLPGCVSQGDTEEEALANIKEAIELYIEDLLANDEPVPEDKVQIRLVQV
jgi:predicted RNase H-like HicB family nuclease